MVERALFNQKVMGVNRRAVIAPWLDLEAPEGGEKRSFVSSNRAGLRRCRDISPKSKRESDQNTG